MNFKVNNSRETGWTWSCRIKKVFHISLLNRSRPDKVLEISLEFHLKIHLLTGFEH